MQKLAEDAHDGVAVCRCQRKHRASSALVVLASGGNDAVDRNHLKRSETDSMPSADDLRPVKGYVSGPLFTSKL